MTAVIVQVITKLRNVRIFLDIVVLFTLLEALRGKSGYRFAL